MGLSSSLLLLAVIVAVIPVGLVGARAPESIRDLEKVVVSGAVLLVVGAVVVHGFHDLDVFGLIHLAYLLVVVSLPIMLGAWFLLSHRRGRRRVDELFGVIAALIAVAGLYATHVEPNWLRVDRAELRADVATPLRVGVLADLQTPNVGSHEQRAVDRLVEAEPDLVVIPGDLFQGVADDLERERAAFVDLVRQLVEGSGLVAVVSGDSDHAIDVASIVEEAGAFFIDDTVLAFDLGGVPVRLAGVRVAPGIDRSNALATLTTPTDGLTIVVSHRPDVVYELPAGSDVDLVVAGHTHGGQVQLPFFGPPITFTGVPRDIAAGGIGLVDDVPLYVSAGVGMERLQAPQVRFGARPEVGVIEIVPR